MYRSFSPAIGSAADINEDVTIGGGIGTFFPNCGGNGGGGGSGGPALLRPENGGGGGGGGGIRGTPLQPNGSGGGGGGGGGGGQVPFELDNGGGGGSGGGGGGFGIPAAFVNCEEGITGAGSGEEARFSECGTTAGEFVCDEPGEVMITLGTCVISPSIETAETLPEAKCCCCSFESLPF